jgi:phosphoribosylaminoimidazole-succinocarboxamide synthase
VLVVYFLFRVDLDILKFYVFQIVRMLWEREGGAPCGMVGRDFGFLVVATQDLFVGPKTKQTAVHRLAWSDVQMKSRQQVAEMRSQTLRIREYSRTVFAKIHFITVLWKLYSTL